MIAVPDFHRMMLGRAESPAGPHLATSNSPDEATAPLDNSAALRLALGHLDAHDAYLLHLIYFDDTRIDEVADALRSPATAVRQRVGRAMIQLGRVLARDGEADRPCRPAQI